MRSAMSFSAAVLNGWAWMSMYSLAATAPSTSFKRMLAMESLRPRRPARTSRERPCRCASHHRIDPPQGKADPAHWLCG